MKSATSISLIVSIQIVLDVFMWYFALQNAIKYQEYWAILFAVNIILVALVMLIILRHYIKRSDVYG